MEYNLIDDPWLAVRRRGKTERASLRTALVESQTIASLALTPAPVMAAVFRLLLAVLLDAVGHPTDRATWAAWRSHGQFDSLTLDRYFDQHRPRFNLFDDVAPFAQVAGLRAANDEVKPSSVLVPSLPTGNNVPLFGARTDADPPALPWWDAVGWLLALHAWDTAGIKTGAVGDPQVKAGKTTGNPVGPLGRLGVLIPVGPTLFDTLLLNALIIQRDPRPGADSDPGGRPHWRRPPVDATWTEREPEGTVDLLTWQARRVRLIPSVVRRTGITVVRGAIVAAGDRLPSTPQYEPHTAWVASTRPQAGQPEVRPRGHRSGRALWRGLDGLLAASQGTTSSMTTSLLLAQVGQLQAVGAIEDDFPLGVEATGVEYGTQSAVVETFIHDAIPLPVVALRADLDVGEAVERLATDTVGLVKAVDVLEADLCRALGGELAPWDKGQRASERLVQRLDLAARRVLAGLQHEPSRVEEALDAWTTVARRATRDTGDELLSQLPPAAMQGRQDGNRSYHASGAELRFRRQVRTVLPSSGGDVEDANGG